jgi:N-acetylglucosaminyl-diphospho-decaprenol L-rhamnosyltransferase
VPDVPVVRIGIVLFENARPELERLARSLSASLLPADLRCEPWLMDNSPDNRLADVAASVFPDASYRWMGENRGFGAAHNVGMREAFAAGLDAYVCLNPDSVLHPRCIEQLCATAQTEGTGLVDARTFPEEHPKPYDPRTGDTAWCTGTALLVTPRAFEVTSGFDEALFMYGEDVDLSWRVRAAELRTRTSPEAFVLHWVEYRSLERPRRLQVLRSAAYLGRKWGAPAFARSYERLYRELSGAALALPSVAVVARELRGVADFSHGVRFASSRW